MRYNMHIFLDLQSWQNVNETPSPKHIKCTKSLPPRTMLVEQQCNMVSSCCQILRKTEWCFYFISDTNIFQGEGG